MTKEQLLAAGFTDAQVENILKLHKEAIDGNYVAKHRFDEVNSEAKTAKEQLSERDKQIAELKKFEGDAKELKEKITMLEAANAERDTTYKTQLALERKKNAVRIALLEDESGKPHDVEMVMGLFDLEKISVDDNGKITAGYADQHETIRKDKAFLFSEVQKNTNKGGTGWKASGVEPKDSDKGAKTETDAFVGYGKSLAQVKLGMMGVKPAGTNNEN